MSVFDLLNKVDIAKELGFGDIEDATRDVSASYTYQAGTVVMFGLPMDAKDHVTFIFKRLKENAPKTERAKKAIEAALANSRFDRHRNDITVDDSVGELAISMPKDNFEQLFKENGAGVKLKLGLLPGEVVNILTRHRVDLSGDEKNLVRNEYDPRDKRISLIYPIKNMSAIDSDAAIERRLPGFHFSGGRTYELTPDSKKPKEKFFVVNMSLNQYVSLGGRSMGSNGLSLS